MDKEGKLEGGGLRLEIWRIEKTFLFVCLFHFWVILGTECISNPAQVTKTSIFSFLKNENNRQKYKKNGLKITLTITNIFYLYTLNPCKL